MKMPVVFIGHGSPVNAVSDNDFTRSLKALGKSLSGPKSILMVSAHWLAGSTFVCCDKKPGIIYDFYGFPEELYRVEYPAKGDPKAADETAVLLRKYGVSCGRWGLDHGAWTVLHHMYPAADIPVFQLSVDYTKPAEYHYEMAKSLAPLRDRGVLIIGSGNIVHNLRTIKWDTDAEPFEWAEEFDEKVKKLLLKAGHDGLMHYEKLGKSAAMAVPTNDHYLPMMYPLALAGKDKIEFTYEGIQNGSISMRCFISTGS
jgi:4,5-DOPA dioxygenase extradiol